MSEDYRPRLSIDISPEQANKLRDLIPWGLKNQIFLILIDDLIGLLEEFGLTPIVFILEGTIKPRQALRALRSIEDGNSLPRKETSNSLGGTGTPGDDTGNPAEASGDEGQTNNEAVNDNDKDDEGNEDEED